MKLEKLPFHPEGFINHARYRDAKNEFYRNAYEGKTAQFNCEIVSLSGLIVRSPGDKVIIREYDSCGMFRLSELDGSDIYGLWKPDCIDIVNPTIGTRVFFVGIHNKPGLTPLCSSTRSGKLIDRIIAKIPGAEVIKTNLYQCDYMPPIDPLAAQKWATRVGYKRGDIVFSLGAITHQHFRRSGIKFIPIGHPSGVWSHEKQNEYVAKALVILANELNPF